MKLTVLVAALAMACLGVLVFGLRDTAAAGQFVPDPSEVAENAALRLEVAGGSAAEAGHRVEYALHAKVAARTARVDLVVPESVDLLAADRPQAAALKAGNSLLGSARLGLRAAPEGTSVFVVARLEDEGGVVHSLRRTLTFHGEGAGGTAAADPVDGPPSPRQRPDLARSE